MTEPPAGPSSPSPPPGPKATHPDGGDSPWDGGDPSPKPVKANHPTEPQPSEPMPSEPRPPVPVRAYEGRAYETYRERMLAASVR